MPPFCQRLGGGVAAVRCGAPPCVSCHVCLLQWEGSWTSWGCAVPPFCAQEPVSLYLTPLGLLFILKWRVPGHMEVESEIQSP